MSNLVKVGALWRGKDKEGRPMLTGTMGDARLLVLVNSYKEEEKHPDYIVYVAAREKKAEAEEEAGADEDAPF